MTRTEWQVTADMGGTTEIHIFTGEKAARDWMTSQPVEMYEGGLIYPDRKLRKVVRHAAKRGKAKR